MARSVAFLSDVPSCTTKQQYVLWRDAAKMFRPHARVGFCEDCTKEYQEQMIAEGRCENPHVWFCEDEDGFEHGTLKQEGSNEVPRPVQQV